MPPATEPLPVPNPRDTGAVAAEPSRPWTHQRLSELEREVARLRERVEALEGARR